jgi:hypothetical protein
MLTLIGDETKAAGAEVKQGEIGETVSLKFDFRWIVVFARHKLGV